MTLSDKKEIRARLCRLLHYRSDAGIKQLMDEVLDWIEHPTCSECGTAIEDSLHIIGGVDLKKIFGCTNEECSLYGQEFIAD